MIFGNLERRPEFAVRNSSIEYSTTAGEALNPEVYEQWKRATGFSIYEGFGQTETTLSIYNPVGSVPKSGSMGIPSPLYDVDLILPDGTPAPVGETGEIVIRTHEAICSPKPGFAGSL